MFFKLHETLQLMFPGSIANKDYILQDNSDGRGPYIAQWNLSDAQPSIDDLQTYWNQNSQNYKEPESEMDLLKKQQADLTFQLMMAGVI